MSTLDLLPPEFCSQKHYIFVDEVGRGCLAGPVVVGAVLWQPKNSPSPKSVPAAFSTLRKLGVNDSKKVSAKDRFPILSALKLNPLQQNFSSFKLEEDNFFALYGQTEVTSIESSNILHATLDLMRQVALQLCQLVNISSQDSIAVVIDGKIKIPGLENCGHKFSQLTLPKADALFAPLGLASIFAKVYRDYQMEVWEKIYPHFGLGQHKGYGTAKHLEAIKKFKPSPIHRQTFAGVKEHLDASGLSS